MRHMIFLLCLVPFIVCAQANEQILRTISTSVIKVTTQQSAASGFIYADQRYAVTALHVIDGKGPITVSYVDGQGKITASSRATVAKVFKQADLVLLKITNPQSRPPLKLQLEPLQIRQQLDAVGFPLNIAGQSNTEVKVRFGGKQLQSIVPQHILAKIVDYPSVTEPIVNLEGNLVPGLSGAPIIDSNGHVVGVVNGGLENGAVGICWGIPASQLVRLSQSNDTQLPGKQAINELFSADLNVDVATVNFAGTQLIRLRSRTFAQLAATADDQLGLTQLANVFAMHNPYSFVFDIYQDPASGAVIVLPNGMQLEQINGYTAATFNDGRNMMVYRVFNSDNHAWLQQMAVQFENELIEAQPGIQAQIDPQWSYLQPLQLGNVLINRKAFMRYVSNGYNWWNDRYYFETLALSPDTLLAVAAIDMAKTPQVMEQEQYCFNGFAGPQCPQLVAQNRHWAHMVLAVQFATIPPYYQY